MTKREALIAALDNIAAFIRVNADTREGDLFIGVDDKDTVKFAAACEQVANELAARRDRLRDGLK